MEFGCVLGGKYELILLSHFEDRLCLDSSR